MARQHLATYLDDFAGDAKNTAYVFARGLRTLRTSYRELAHGAWRTSHWFREQGLAPGDRVVLCGANSGDWATAFWGCLAGGFVAVPVDAQASLAYVRRVVEETEARVLFTDEGNPVAGLPAELQVVRFPALPSLVQSFPAQAPEAELSRDAVAQIIYTSGSTANPKGVVLTHGNTLASLEPMEREIGRYLHWERPFHPVRFLVQLPLSHVFGQMMGLFTPPLLRGEMHFLPELSPAAVIETIAQRRISVMATVPRYLELLGAELRRGSEQRWGADGYARRIQASSSVHFLRRWWLFRDVHSRLGWKFWAFVCGGASLPEETEQLWRLLGYAVIQGYGMTETASLISVNHPFKMSRGSIGKSMPGREIRIGEGGEIQVRGQTVSPGYWRKGGAIQKLSEEEQWFSTGDLAEVDAEGNLFFRGRRKEIIVTANGMNVYPEDVEGALRAQPGIREAVVVGAEDKQGPVVFAALTATEPEGALRAVVESANASLEPHQRVGRWALWPEPDFPRTGTRKIRRGLVREFADALLSGRSVEATRGDTLESLLAANGARWEGDLRDEMRMEADLALDSLGRVQVLSAMESHYQVRLDESALGEQTTVGELRAMLAREMGSGVAPGSATAEGAADSAVPPASAATQIAKPYPFPNWPSSWWASAFRQAFSVLALRPLTRFYSARAKLIGVEHLTEIQGPALWVANHLTEIDGALIAGRLPWRIARKYAIAMSGEMLRSYKYPAPSETWYWKLWLPIQYLLVVLSYGVFPLPRTSGFRRAFQHAGMLVDKGYHILVFPEGRRSPSGELLPFQHGIGILTKELNLPVVPVRIKGVHELRELGRTVARRGEVTLHIGKPIRFDAEVEPAAIAAELERAVREL